MTHKSEGLTEAEEAVVEEDLSEEVIEKNKADFKTLYRELNGRCPECKARDCICEDSYRENQVREIEAFQYQERESDFINNFNY